MTDCEIKKAAYERGYADGYKQAINDKTSVNSNVTRFNSSLTRFNSSLTRNFEATSKQLRSKESDGMTHEEVIMNITCRINNDIEDFIVRSIHEYGMNQEIVINAKMISEAIGKQIPKKKHKYMGYRCVCGEEVAKNQRYCEYCGQKLLDWSES